MNTYITRILGIAPYEAMKNLMKKLAGDRQDLILDAFAGDLEEGVRTVRRNLASGYDVIISRGGTAQMISQITSVPVIEINMSAYDVLRAIKLSENYSDRYAIVGFPSITESAHLFCSVLQYEIDIFTIYKEEEVRGIVRKLKAEGYHMLLCDMITNTVAKEFGLNAILITSGEESIINAFDQAVKLSQSYIRLHQEKLLLEKIIQEEPSSKVVFNLKGEVIFTFWNKNELDPDVTIAALKTEMAETLAKKKYKFFKTIQDKLFAIESIVLQNKDNQYLAFYLNETKIPPLSSKHGISYFYQRNRDEHFFNSFYSISGASGISDDAFLSLARSPQPLMLTGEPGTGKMQTIRTLHTRGSLSANPLITINFGLINDKSWEFLMNHYNSPLTDNDNTLCFKNADELSNEQCRRLLSAIIDMNLSKRNRLIFSYVSREGISKSPICRRFTDTLGCLTLHQVPLRERIADIPALSSLYLSTLNVQLAKQIIGFEPEAMALMQQYEWPQNQTQFKRIIGQLATITTTPYIRTDDVKLLLKQESTSITAISVTEGGLNLNLNRTLEEITQDIIIRVLHENNGNQSAAAKQLGISRTTLWRYLKQS